MNTTERIGTNVWVRTEEARRGMGTVSGCEVWNGTSFLFVSFADGSRLLFHPNCLCPD